MGTLALSHTYDLSSMFSNILSSSDWSSINMLLHNVNIAFQFKLLSGTFKNLCSYMLSPHFLLCYICSLINTVGFIVLYIGTSYKLSLWRLMLVVCVNHQYTIAFSCRCSDIKTSYEINSCCSFLHIHVFSVHYTLSVPIKSHIHISTESTNGQVLTSENNW